MTNSDLPSGPPPGGRIPFDRIVLVHGFRAATSSHWFPWLAETLPNVEIVELPDSAAPRADTWIPLAKDAIGVLEPRTAVVTHSLGGITALRAIAELQEHDSGAIGCLVAVAPFARTVPQTGDAELDEFVATGLPAFLADFHPPVVRPAIDRAAVIRSDDDPLVPGALSDEFAKALGENVGVETVPGAGHFLDREGITRLPAVLNALIA